MESRNLLAYKAGKISESQYNAMAAYKGYTYGNYEDLDANCSYLDYDLCKIGSVTTVRYPYIINDPINFVEKAIGSDFYTNDDTPTDTITIYCNSWIWAYYETNRDDANFDDDMIPDIYDHADIIDSDIYEAD